MLASDVVERTLGNWIYPGGIQRPAYDTLAVALNASELTLELTGRLTNIPDDSILQIDYETMLVSAVAGTTLTLQERGYLESGEDNHAVNSIVEVDPTYSKTAVFNALTALIGTLYPAGVYWRNTDSPTVDSAVPTKTLPAGGLRVISVLAQKSSASGEWQRLRAGIDYLEMREFDPTRYTVLRGGFAGGPLQVVYAKDFGVPTGVSDDLTALGVPESLQPHLPMGVAGMLLMGRELPRIQIEEIRRFLASQGIQIGASLNVGQGLLNYFMGRYVGAERDRLMDQDPSSFEFIRS